ncbi:MAG TPA: PfkB family carbohydrate kinase [Planctomycetota bacterium]|jgi:1-phosphofructokinase family hexose kinase
MRAVTVTLNPAVDRILQIKTLTRGGTFDADLMLTVPAGKGVNTARSLRSVFDGPIVAATWIGSDQAAWFKSWLAEHHGIRAASCERNGIRTRFAYTVLEQCGRETHMKENMRGVEPAHERALLAFLQKTIRRGDLVALCGSAPKGTTGSTIRKLLDLAREKGAAAVIADTNGEPLEVAGAAGLYGLKGNAAEIGGWLRLPDVLRVTKKTHRRALLAAFEREGAPKTILMTMGAAGALMAVPGRIFVAAPPPLGKKDCRAATGCGDAATAGWLWAMSDGCSPAETLRRAVCCGTAKLASPDPGGLDVRRVRKFLKRVVVSEVR